MAHIVVEFHDGTLAAVQLLANPGRTAARVQNACAKRFQTGVGTLSPKNNPNLLLEEEDAVPGGVTYIFTPFAGSQDVNQGDNVLRLSTATVSDECGACPQSPIVKCTITALRQTGRS